MRIWETRKKNRLWIVSPDKLSIKYTGVGQHGHDVGIVQSNKPAPFKCHPYYCEIYVKDAGVKGRVSIGFTTDNFKTGRHPGVEYEQNRDVGSQIRKLEFSISSLETDLIKIQMKKSELEITEKAANKINNWQKKMGGILILSYINLMASVLRFLSIMSCQFDDSFISDVNMIYIVCI